MLLTPFTADAEDELTKNFVAKYQEKFKEVPNQFAADGYDTIMALYDACVAAKVDASMDNAKICDLLIAQFTNPEFKINGLTGTDMTWSESGEVSKQPKGMVIKNGAYVGIN